MKAASALSSNQALPDLTPEVTAALTLLPKAASTVAAAAQGFPPFLPGSAKPNPSTTVNGITLAINVTEVCALLHTVHLSSLFYDDNYVDFATCGAGEKWHYVGVTVSGVAKATTYDALAIYLQDPSDSTVKLNRLIKYTWANENPAYIKTGNTTFRHGRCPLRTRASQLPTRMMH